MEVKIDWWIWLWENDIFFLSTLIFSNERGAGSPAESQKLEGFAKFERGVTVGDRHLERWENELTKELQVECQGGQRVHLTFVVIEVKECTVKKRCGQCLLCFCFELFSLVAERIALEAFLKVHGH